MKVFAEFFIFILVALIIGSIVLYTLINGIAPTPSSSKVLPCLQAALPEKITGNIVEAGAGWGGVALWFARHYPQNHILAWENSWVPFLILWIRVKLSRYKNIQACYGHFNRQPLDQTGLIYTFLCRKGMQTVKKWINRYPQHPLTLVSQDFSLPGNIYDKEITISQWMNNKLYIYHLK